MKIARIFQTIPERFEGIPSGEASITVAAIESEGSVKMGLAFQSPEDQLNRKRSRAIAVGRANKKPAMIVGRTLLTDGRGRLDNQAILEFTQDYLNNKLVDAYRRYNDPWELERETHIPRWLPVFLQEWNSHREEPRLF